MINKTGKFFLLILFLYMSSLTIVMSNGSSFLGRHLSPMYIPVANSIGLNTTWNFFSPDPAHTLYLKYRVLFQDEYGNEKKESIEGYYPSDILDNNFRLDHRRLSYTMRFLIVDPNRIQFLLVPWICKQHPDASFVQTEVELYRIPALDVVQTFKNDQFSDLVSKEEMNKQIYACIKN